MSDNNTDSSSAGSIKPINSETVHKICSGQVVLSLAVAVKELVENSLDAGAKNIDVKLKDYGKELIEVSDDGSGVTEANFAALTLKYHTSKISDYSDLLGVSSYGFRGEALSSLCSLTNLSITTRHKDSTYATKIIYDHKGNITSKTPCSRQIGTTVTLSNLFKSLPVRQKEFHRNFKREFTKMTNLLYAYCLISTGVKITCSNQTSSNSKTLIVATQGSTSFKDNIACVFGIKQLQTLLEIKSEYVSNIRDNIFKGLTGDIKESEESVNIDDIEIDLSEDSNDAAKEITNSQESCTSQKSQGYKNLPSPVELTGYISSCAHGTGRSTTDRQYFFINSRPCEPTKVIKLINEVYRQYNPNQYPFVFLNINLDRISVDINVTPDKRKVFLTKEKGVLDVVKASLLKLFEDIPKTIKLESIKHNDASTHSKTLTPALDQTRVFNSFITKFSHNNSNISRASNENSDLKRKSTTLIDYGIVKKSHNNSEKTTETCLINKSDDYEIPLINDCDSENIIVPQHEKNIDTNVEETTWKKNDNVSDLMFLSDSSILPNTQIRNVSEIIEDSHQIYCKTKQSERPPKQKVKKVITDKGELGKCKRKSITLKTSMEHVKALFDVYKEKKNRNIPERIKFKSTINPVFNKKCEEELSREISKESFKRMAIVGQFNLGFIITVLDDDLFIIDQHATDEIYNFETLQKTTELTSQKLVIPQKLELTGVNEQVLMDNLDVFKKNGFTFEIDKDASPTKRVKLLTIPMSKNWVFGKEDIEELLFMLRENYYEHCRPSRVRAMFASRACRKSVMIGTALNKADMRKLVDHMSEIDKPWNCPHGRPTIRHLINLAMVHTKED